MRALGERLLAAPGLTSLSGLLQAYVRRGGKRIRPQLTLWTFEHAAPGRVRIDRAALLDVASAWELFHAFLLIHDDIIDGSDRRRESASLHRQLEHLDNDSPRFGVNLGIVAGDLMYAATHRVLADLDVPAEAYRELHRLFAHVAALTGFGQAVDILQSHAPLGECEEETLLREYHWKTAAYTFEGPMLSAAILARLDAPAREAISRFALSLGQAYQLQNDLIDLSQPASEGCDLIEGKRTLTLIRARASMPRKRQLYLDEQMLRIQCAVGPAAVKLAESVRQDVLGSIAIEQTRDTITSLLEASSLASEDVSLPPSLAKAMGELLDTLRQSYFATTPSPVTT